MTIGLAMALRNDRADRLTVYAGANAIMRIYSGSRPSTGGTATTQLAQLTCNSVFAAAATNAQLTLNAIAPATSANNTGTAAWYRQVRSDGTTHCWDGSVSTVAAGNGDMRLDDTAIVLGGTVAISSAVYTEGNA